MSDRERKMIYIGFDAKSVPSGYIVDMYEGVFGVELVRNVPGGHIGFHLLAGDNNGYFWRIGDGAVAFGQEHLDTAAKVLAAARDAVENHAGGDGLPGGFAVYGPPDDGAS